MLAATLAATRASVVVEDEAKEFKLVTLPNAKCLDGSDLRTQECKKTQRAFETAYYSQS